jgi:hypothetical protein
MTEETPKTINITGTNNKYQINKLIHRDVKKEPKKRVDANKWNFPEEYFEYSHQMKILYNILNDNGKEDLEEEKGEVEKVVIQQINKKISGYKQQDIIKKKLNNDKFINFESVIKKMEECKLKCRYCNETMHILYDISREMKQWSVDRVDNDFGHNVDNFHLACLDCNLKRRRRTDEKFLFTKQLNIVKKDS